MLEMFKISKYNIEQKSIHYNIPTVTNQERKTFDEFCFAQNAQTAFIRYKTLNKLKCVLVNLEN